MFPEKVYEIKKSIEEMENMTPYRITWAELRIPNRIHILVSFKNIMI